MHHPLGVLLLEFHLTAAIVRCQYWLWSGACLHCILAFLWKKLHCITLWPSKCNKVDSCGCMLQQSQKIFLAFITTPTVYWTESYCTNDTCSRKRACYEKRAPPDTLDEFVDDAHTTRMAKPQWINLSFSWAPKKRYKITMHVSEAMCNCGALKISPREMLRFPRLAASLSWGIGLQPRWLEKHSFFSRVGNRQSNPLCKLIHSCKRGQFPKSLAVLHKLVVQPAGTHLHAMGL